MILISKMIIMMKIDQINNQKFPMQFEKQHLPQFIKKEKKSLSTIQQSLKRRSNIIKEEAIIIHFHMDTDMVELTQ